MSWTSRTGGTFHVYFDSQDLEILVSGERQLDIHNKYNGGDTGLIEFTLNSYSSSFSVSHMCSGGTISNVPVPASSERIWRVSKTSSYVYVYCSGVLVGQFSRSSSWSCLSDDQWNNFGSYIYFYSDSHAVTHYRVISSKSIKFIVVSLCRRR